MTIKMKLSNSRFRMIFEINMQLQVRSKYSVLALKYTDECIAFWGINIVVEAKK